MLNNLNLETFSRILISIALVLQLFNLKKNKFIYSPSFLILSLGSYMMAYKYYKINTKYTSRVIFKLFNATILLLISIFSM